MSAQSKKSVSVSDAVATSTTASTHAHQTPAHEGSVPMKKSSKKSPAVSDTVQAEPTGTAKKSPAVSDTVQAQPTGIAEPVPVSIAPTPPSTYVPSVLQRGMRPQQSQINLALKVATELRGSANYTQQFGDTAPNPVGLADALTLARGWSDKLQNAKAWYEYVRQQENVAWKQAFTLSAPLRVPFEFRLARDASVAEEYPSLEAFLGTAKAAAKKGVATRKKKAEKKMGTAAAATPPTQSATPSKLLN